MKQSKWVDFLIWYDRSKKILIILSWNVSRKKFADHLTDRVFLKKFDTLFETSRQRKLSKAKYDVNKISFLHLESLV